jgi:hypothetical protein
LISVLKVISHRAGRTTEALEHGNDAHCYSEVINDLFLQLHVMYHGVGPRRGAARVPIPRFFC